MLNSFIHFYRAADTKYTIHSPFVFEFITEILEDQRLYYAYHEVETVRKILLQSHETITVKDYGAGSKFTNATQRPVRQIAKTALSSARCCRTLFKIVKHFKPTTILEMGTSLGISTAYLKMAALNAQLTTLEGCPNISKVAKNVFRRLKLSGIDQQIGPFLETLPTALSDLKKIDLAFLDGNHQLEPTLVYFDKLLPYLQEDSILILDDIYWSKEMTTAWEALKNRSEVTMSIDLYDLGILFFKKDFKSKQHFKLVPWYAKPWRMGFFS